MNPAASSSLGRFAARVTGPIDAAINFVVNLAFPLGFLWGRSDVPLYGWGGWSTFLIVVGFCVGLFPTYFGYRNGVHYQRDALGDTTIAGRPWRRVAFADGLASGIGLAVALGAAIYGAHRFFPAATLSFGVVSFANAAISAVLAYAMQVRGVLRTRKWST